MNIQSKLIGLVALLALVTMSGPALIGSAEAAKLPKVAICHNTGSETNPVVLIEVSGNAAPAHIANHGDTLAVIGPDGEATCPTTAPGG
jgi:hypothetical protein